MTRTSVKRRSRRTGIIPTVRITAAKPLRTRRVLSHITLSTALAGGPVLPVTFGPSTELKCRVRLALTPDYTLPYWQWGWADITEYVRWDPGITVTDGRRDERGTVSTLSGSMTLENDGRFSRRNPFSPYHPFLTRNTPIWAEVNPGDAWHTRLMGYVNEWPKRWDTTGRDSIVPIQVGGIKRRLDADQTSKSPMARTISGRTVSGSTPIAYWPMEDGENATQFASAVAGVDPMVLGGDITLAVSDEIPGSLPLPIWQAGSNAVGTVPSHTDAGTWTVTATVLAPEDLIVQNQAVTVFRAVMSGGLYSSVSVGIQSTEQFSVVTRDAQGQVADQWFDFFPTGTVLGTKMVVSVTATNDASGTDDGWSAKLIDADGTVVATISETSGAGHYGQITHVIPNGQFALASDTVIGHVGVWVDGLFTPGTDDVAIADGLDAYDGETVADRLGRVCREATIPYQYGGTATTRLGPQPAGTTSAVLADAEKGGLGVLFEHEFGFSYVSPNDLYNQTVHLPIDQAAGQLAESVEADDDDQGYYNQWTASRPDGSSATVRDGDYQASDGLFAGGSSYNVYTDAQLPHIAGWEVHKGTIDEDRWPMLAINLRNHPELIPYWVAMPFGGRTQVTSPHEEVGVDLIDAIREGRTERWNSLLWEARMNTSPASVHDIPTYDGGARFGARSSVLVDAIDENETSLIVNPNGATWITGASHPSRFPFSVEINGIDYQCIAINDAAPNYNLTIVRLATDRPHPVGARVRPSQTGRYGK